MNILITGAAGFIGFSLTKYLLDINKFKIIGIDNISEYYDTNLKLDRLKILKKNSRFKFYKFNLDDNDKLIRIFKKHKIKIVVHLAAQAGVRYSIQNPRSYLNSNIISFFNIIDASRIYKIKHFIFASSSSVYGNNSKFPTKEKDDTSSPLSFYASTKKANEVMAFSYANIYKLPCTGLRFFTVYGPYGRPDMSLFKFTEAISNNKAIELYNNGNHIRDFTYIDDLIKIIHQLLYKKSKNKIPFEVYNLASSSPKNLKDYISLIEKYLGKKAKIKNLKIQQGDVYKTHASTSKVKNIIKIKSKISLENGIRKFINWYKEYYES